MTMKLEHIAEPLLTFARGEHICPRRGIATYGVFDLAMGTRRTDVVLGGLGSAQCLEALSAWIVRCTQEMPGAISRQPNLRVGFPGFRQDDRFGAHFKFGEDLTRAFKKSEIESILKLETLDARIEAAVQLYYEHLKFLAQNRPVDVIVCVIPQQLFKALTAPGDELPTQEQLPVTEEIELESNFRRSLKARAMHLGKPLQLIRAASLEGSAKGQQDEATKAWNFCTAIYYKAGPRIPWKLQNDPHQPASCAVGIAFYRSRDRQSLHTSLAQIFDELGNGLILRGSPIDLRREDRVPHLSEAQAHELLTHALTEYRVALRNYPARVVLHKSSNYDSQEIAGFSAAAQDLRIDTLDLVTVFDSKLRLFRDGSYPPYRGTKLQLDEVRHLLYTRGAVWYFQTYTGLYIPQPLELRVVRSEVSPTYLSKEVLGLSKMNWNNTQFDGKYPVTLGCARKVGEIMKYLPEQEHPQIRYGFYM